MKRYIIFVFLSLILIMHISARSAKYLDEFCVRNSTNKIIHVQYTGSTQIIPAHYGSYLDMKIYMIPLRRFHENEDIKISPYKELFLWFGSYMRDEYNKITPWEKFKLIVATLTVTDEEGNVLLTFDDIIEEDFEISIEGGITTATLIIQKR